MLDRVITFILVIIFLFFMSKFIELSRSSRLFSFVSSSLGYGGCLERDSLVSCFFSNAKSAMIEKDKYLIDIINPKYRLNDAAPYEENYIENNDKVIMKEILEKYEDYLCSLYFSDKLFPKVSNKQLKKLGSAEFFMITLYMFFLNNKRIFSDPDLLNIVDYSGKVCSQTDVAIVYYKMYYYAATFCYNSKAANDVGVFCTSTDEIEIGLENELKNINNPYAFNINLIS